MWKQITCLALVAAASCQTIDQLFTVDAATCGGYDLNTYLNDARTMLASAQTGITSVKNAKTFVGTSNNRNYMRNAANAFGTRYYPITTRNGISSGDSGTISEASTNIAMVQTLLGGNTAGPNGARLGPNNAKIFCSDTPYVETTDAHDIDPSKPQGTSTQEAFAVPSLYYVPDPNNNGIQRTVVKPNPNMPGRICQTVGDTAVIALTQTQTLFTPDEPLIQMILCPAFFNQANFQQSISVSPKSSDYLGNWKFAAGTFIHELYHIFGDTFNDKRFYATGSTDLQDPYGPEVIYSLANKPGNFQAQYGAIDVLTLPDTYRMFCTMSQFPGTKWSSYPLGTSSKKRAIGNAPSRRRTRRRRQSMPVEEHVEPLSDTI